MPKQVVTIENPPAGCRAETSMERARRYQRSGRAVFVTPTSIRFLATGMQAMIVKDAEAVAAARITGVGYDRVTEAFHRCAAHIPIVNVNAMIREERSGRDWSYRAAVLRRGSKANDNGVLREVGTSPFSS